MDWLSSIVAGLILVLLVAPPALLVITFLVLVPLAHLAPRPAMLARQSFECPYSHRKVSATFMTSPATTAPADVLQCSLFGVGRVTCQKRCLDLAAVGWAPSAMVPRYGLVAGDTAYR